MREQENLWEPYSSAMLTEVQASLDAKGKLQDWNYELSLNYGRLETKLRSLNNLRLFDLDGNGATAVRLTKDLDVK